MQVLAKNIFRIALFLAPPLFASVVEPTGSVCLAPIAIPNTQPASLANPSGGNRSFNFEIQINRLPKLKISTTTPQKIVGLSISQPHRVRIFRDGRPVESFTFNFSDFKRNNLCLWLKELYETWSLTDTVPGGVRCD